MDADDGGPLMAAPWHHMSTKRENGVTIPADGRWHRLDVQAAPDPVAGNVDHMLYLHLKPRFKTGRTVGSAMVRYVRHNDPDGATGYHYFGMHKGFGLPWYPLQPVHFEAGRQGIGGHWEIRLYGGLRSIAASTRYAKAQGVGAALP